MGILDRLMFWKDDEVDHAAYSANETADGTNHPAVGADEYEVEGCFTLPSDQADALDADGDLLAEALEDSTDQIQSELEGQSEALTDTLGGNADNC